MLESHCLQGPAFGKSNGSEGILLVICTGAMTASRARSQVLVGGFGYAMLTEHAVAATDQPKPAEANGGDTSQDRPQAPTDQPEATAPTHEQPQVAGDKQPAASAQGQPPAPAQSVLARDPQRAQNAVHPGNGNIQVQVPPL